jgi:hypothetical protein
MDYLTNMDDIRKTFGLHVVIITDVEPTKENFRYHNLDFEKAAGLVDGFLYMDKRFDGKGLKREIDKLMGRSVISEVSIIEDIVEKIKLRK